MLALTLIDRGATTTIRGDSQTIMTVPEESASVADVFTDLAISTTHKVAVAKALHLSFCDGTAVPVIHEDTMESQSDCRFNAARFNCRFTWSHSRPTATCSSTGANDY